MKIFSLESCGDKDVLVCFVVLFLDVWILRTTTPKMEKGMGLPPIKETVMMMLP